MPMGIRSLVGFSMRLYRGSFLYPRLGRSLARLMSYGVRLRGAAPVVRTVGGITYELDLREVIDSSLFFSGTFEAQAEQVIERALQPGMIAVDVGANIGYHTFRMARAVGPDGCVLAIEPTAWAFRKLQRNAALNPYGNIRFLKVGLTDRDQGPTAVTFTSSYRLDGSVKQELETVPLVRLDTLVREQGLSRVDFIKVDVDGHEGKVFSGAAETLERFRPILFFELSPSAMRECGDDFRELLSRLGKLDYRFASEAGEPLADIAASCERIADGYSANFLALPTVRMG